MTANITPWLYVPSLKLVKFIIMSPLAIYLEATESIVHTTKHPFCLTHQSDYIHSQRYVVNNACLSTQTISLLSLSYSVANYWQGRRKWGCQWDHKFFLVLMEANTSFLTLIGMRQCTFNPLSFLDLIFGIWFFFKKFQKNLEVKIDINLTPCQAHWVLNKYPRWP